MKMIAYVRKDAVALLADASLEAEGEVVAADHDAAPKALLERLHVRLNTREVQPLTWDGGGTVTSRGGRRIQ